MAKNIADGEYDLDFSGLFSTVQSDVFGIRYGFKPDTIDEAFPSFLYRDIGGSTRQTSPTRSRENGMIELTQPNMEVPVYLVCESKENAKAITTNLSKDDHIYFEGRSRPNTSTHQIPATPMSISTAPTSSFASVVASENSNQHLSSMSEFLLCYDDVSKSFKVDFFNGFIKMNKSREPDVVSGKINKLARRQPSNSQNASTSPSTRSYIESLIASFGNSTGGRLNAGSSNRRTSPMRQANTTQNDTGIIKPYGKSISGISPVRRNVSNSPLESPTKSAFQPSKTLSPLPVSAPLPTQMKPPSPLRVSSSPSPILKTAKNGSTPTNGGTGTRKTQRSLLLRKAERAVGIKKSRVYKPKLKDSTLKEKELLPSAISAPPKPVESTGLRIRQRELKEARPEQAEFELVLNPPAPAPTPTVVSPAKKATKLTQKEKKQEAELMVTKKTVNKAISKAKSKLPTKSTPQTQTKVSLSDEDLDSFAEELVSELDTATEDANSKSDRSPELAAEKKNTIASKPLVPKETEKPRTQTNDAFDDDFNIEFSDWEDADAVDGPVISDENELTAGNSEFQLIIEDDPLKSKEMKERKKLQQEGASAKLNGSDEPRQTQTQTHAQNLTDPAKAKNTTKTTTTVTKNSVSASSATPKKSVKTKATAATKTKKKTGTPQKGKHGGSAPHLDDEIDRELDAELDKAFDDLLDEEDMSEEE